MEVNVRSQCQCFISKYKSGHVKKHTDTYKYKDSGAYEGVVCSLVTCIVVVCVFLFVCVCVCFVEPDKAVARVGAPGHVG